MRTFAAKGIKRKSLLAILEWEIKIILELASLLQVAEDVILSLTYS